MDPVDSSVHTLVTFQPHRTVIGSGEPAFGLFLCLRRNTQSREHYAPPYGPSDLGVTG